MEYKSLTESKFREILKKKEATEDVQLTKVELKSGAEKGQNYSGLVVCCHLEAEVKGQQKTYEWMAKTPLNDPTRYDLNRMTYMEQKELGFYQDLLPALKDFISKKGLDMKLAFCPFVYGEFKEHIPKEECVHGSMIIMEHLGHMGYSEPVNKKSGLDLDHVKLVMKSLGEFHATSRAFYRAKHGDLEDIVAKEPIQARDYCGSDPIEAMAAMMEQFNSHTTTTIIKTLTIISADGQIYADSFKRFAKEVMEPLKMRDQLSRPDACKFNVLCHGDLWFNNMLFKYDEQKPTDVCLVDLAITKWASPAIDLSYFLFMSTTPELRQAHMDEILDYYHQSLTTTLKELEEDPNDFNLSELKADYKKCSFFGFMVSLMALPLILAKKEDAMGSEEISGDFTDPKVVKKLNETLDERSKKSITNEPQIGNRLSGAFLEMVENGYFTL